MQKLPRVTSIERLLFYGKAHSGTNIRTTFTNTYQGGSLIKHFTSLQTLSPLKAFRRRSLIFVGSVQLYQQFRGRTKKKRSSGDENSPDVRLFSPTLIRRKTLQIHGWGTNENSIKFKRKTKNRTTWEMYSSQILHTMTATRLFLTLEV